MDGERELTLSFSTDLYRYPPMGLESFLLLSVHLQPIRRHK